MSDHAGVGGKVKVAIIGSGNIGTDLLVKTQRSSLLECSLFVGRNLHSRGMKRAQELGVRVSDGRIQAIIDEPNCCDVVFDATSAASHYQHWPLLRQLGKIVVDMTPSKIGEMVIPALGFGDMTGKTNVNMVSCGGQASVPIAHTLAKHLPGITYFEVVSSIASKSAGSATRENIDEYIDTTEIALRQYTGCEHTKTILILNPADPPINMQTTISAKVAEADVQSVRPHVEEIVRCVQQYVPGFEMVVPPVFEQNRVVVMVMVRGLGDFLPTFAGNLDIINCAGIAAAEYFAASLRSEKSL